MLSTATAVPLPIHSLRIPALESSVRASVSAASSFTFVLVRRVRHHRGVISQSIPLRVSTKANADAF